MRPLTLVFDLDGTLVDSAPDLMGTLNVILAREGSPPLPVESAGSFVGGGARVLLERGFAADGRVLGEERMSELYLAFLGHYAEHLADNTTAFPGVEPVLGALKAQGHILAVCTNKITEHSERLLAALGLARYFSAVCGRDAFPVAKPDARHLTMTVEKAGGDKGRAIMIGDSTTDIQTAINAGVPSICVDFGYTDIPARDLGADLVISHFSELEAAIAALAARFDR